MARSRFFTAITNSIREIFAGKRALRFCCGETPADSLAVPCLKDRAFFFVSAERILESRNLNFQFPHSEPAALIAFESPLNRNCRTFDTRLRAKLDQQFGRYRVMEQMNLTNAHVTDSLPLSEATNLPSTRTNTDARHLMLDVSDLALFGDAANPFVVNVYGQYRGEPFRLYPSHPQSGEASTIFNMFDSYNSGQVAGNLGEVVFGPGFTPFTLDQKYAASGASLSHQNGPHSWKIGGEFLRTMADGTEANNISNQLFATISDFNQFGPLDSGVDLITYEFGATAQDNRIRLRDNYQGLYDWKLARTLTVNYGLRWDYDSAFPNRLNFSPRVGLAWSLNQKTVVRASWGILYDHYRAGTARDLPELGGANTISAINLEGRVSFWNPATEQMFGWSEAEVIGQLLPIIPPDQQNEFERRLELHKQKHALKSVEVKYLRKDGTFVDANLWTAPLTDSQANVVGTLGITADVTERKQAVEQLRISELSFRQLADSMPQIVWTAAQDGSIGYLNQ